MSLRTDLKRLVEETDTPKGRAFDLTIQALIVLSLITFALETLPDISEPARRALQAIEVATVVIFLVFTAVILFVGLGIVAVPAGVVASALSQARAQEELRAEPNHATPEHDG